MEILGAGMRLLDSGNFSYKMYQKSKLNTGKLLQKQHYVPKLDIYLV